MLVVALSVAAIGFADDGRPAFPPPPIVVTGKIVGRIMASETTGGRTITRQVAILELGDKNKVAVALPPTKTEAPKAPSKPGVDPALERMLREATEQPVTTVEGIMGENNQPRHRRGGGWQGRQSGSPNRGADNDRDHGRQSQGLASAWVGADRRPNRATAKQGG
jgi:hypothetical protein